MSIQERGNNHQTDETDAKFVSLGEVTGVIQNAPLLHSQRERLITGITSLPSYVATDEPEFVKNLKNALADLASNLELENRENPDDHGTVDEQTESNLEQTQQGILDYLSRINQEVKKLKEQQTSHGEFLGDLENILGIKESQIEGDPNRRRELIIGKTDLLSNHLRFGVRAVLGGLMGITYNQLTPAEQNIIIDELLYQQSNPDNSIDLHNKLRSVID
ncbi:hypothetical protein HY385_00310 [Candidatus Daviesbacteria bacterium]|nr:hypothetical protein [Candidatus Daviesbacteria bacterium]